MALLLYIHEINLIINSSICDKDKNLKEVLGGFSNKKSGIAYKDLDVINKSYKEVYKKISSKEVIKELVERSSQEWEQLKPIGKIAKPCKLCGNPKSEEKFIIRNKINKNEMQVGSKCIEKFSKISRSISGEKLQQLIKYNEKDPEIYNRLQKFNEKYNGGKSIIDNWKYEYDKFKIIFPIDFRTDYNRIIKESTKFYKHFKLGKIEENKLPYFENYIVDFNYLMNKCKKFEEKNKKNRFLCTKSIRDALIKDNREGIFKKIEEHGGIIEPWITKYIYNTEFVLRFVVEIENMLKMRYINLDKIEQGNIIISIEAKFDKNIKLNIPTKVFMSNFSEGIYKNINFERSQLLNKMMIFNKEDNIYNFLGVIDTLISEYGYKFEFGDNWYEKGIIEVHKDEMYAEIKMENIIKKNFIFYKSEKEIKRELNNWLDELRWRHISYKKKYNIESILKY